MATLIQSVSPSNRHQMVVDYCFKHRVFDVFHNIVKPVIKNNDAYHPSFELKTITFLANLFREHKFQDGLRHLRNVGKYILTSSIPAPSKKIQKPHPLRNVQKNQQSLFQIVVSVPEVNISKTLAKLNQNPCPEEIVSECTQLFEVVSKNPQNCSEYYNTLINLMDHPNCKQNCAWLFKMCCMIRDPALDQMSRAASIMAKDPETFNDTLTYLIQQLNWCFTSDYSSAYINHDCPVCQPGSDGFGSGWWCTCCVTALFPTIVNHISQKDYIVVTQKIRCISDQMWGKKIPCFACNREGEKRQRPSFPYFDDVIYDFWNNFDLHRSISLTQDYSAFESIATSDLEYNPNFDHSHHLHQKRLAALANLRKEFDVESKNCDTFQQIVDHFALKFPLSKTLDQKNKYINLCASMFTRAQFLQFVCHSFLDSDSFSEHRHDSDALNLIHKKLKELNLHQGIVYLCKTRHYLEQNDSLVKNDYGDFTQFLMTCTESDFVLLSDNIRQHATFDKFIQSAFRVAQSKPILMNYIVELMKSIRLSDQTIHQIYSFVKNNQSMLAKIQSFGFDVSTYPIKRIECSLCKSDYGWIKVVTIHPHLIQRIEKTVGKRKTIHTIIYEHLLNRFNNQRVPCPKCNHNGETKHFLRFIEATDSDDYTCGFTIHNYIPQFDSKFWIKTFPNYLAKEFNILKTIDFS